MPVVAAFTCVFALFVFCAFGARRAQRRADSVGRFSAAKSVLKSISESPRVDVADGHEHNEETPSVHVLAEIGVLCLDRTRSPRRGRSAPWGGRPDADAIARRPTIATLPTMSGALPPNPDSRAG